VFDGVRPTVIDADTSWSLALLLLRVVAVGVLYLFLYTAFRALRDELRGSDTATVPAATAVIEQQVDPALPLPLPERPSVPPTARRIPARIAIPSAAAILVLVLGGITALASRAPAGDTATAPPASTSEPFGPPTATPASGKVTVGLAATEDSQVRVTVDGVVQFEGTLRARERQAWEGTERIQVWTDKGKTLELSVNGKDLGPYSPAMGHPDWNRIDFGFWPGWAP
jgi:hypothetical protein